MALLFLEMSDIIFAVDSVPAIFALTREPLIVFTSNIFAILGLRAMYFMLAGAMDQFHMLKYGLAIVLVFVGLKMVWLNEAFGGKFPISWSLAIILGVIGLSVAVSLYLPEGPGRSRAGRACRHVGPRGTTRAQRGALGWGRPTAVSVQCRAGSGPRVIYWWLPVRCPPFLRHRKYTGRPRTMMTSPGQVVDVR